MEVESVVRRLAFRPGYRLLTYREVGLPFWDVALRCRVLTKKPLGVLDEFALRALAAGLRSPDTLGSFLGLPPSVVEATMAGLLSGGHIVPTPGSSGGGLEYALTQKGQQAAAESEEIRAEELVLPNLSFDGLTHEYGLVDQADRWRPRDIRDQGILEIPAFPADPPDIGPAQTDSLAQSLQPILEEKSLELLSVLGVEGRRSKFFVRGLALIFESTDVKDDISVHFAIDGRPSGAHDLAFAEAEGLRKLGILRSLRDEHDEIEALLGPDLAGKAASEVEVTALRRTTDQVRDRLEAATHRLSSIDDDSLRPGLEDEVARLADLLDESEQQLAEIAVRVIDVHEHPPLLAEALQEAQERILVVSPWIREAVVDDAFIETLEKALSRGVRVYVGYGIDDGRSEGPRDKAVLERLQELAMRRSTFRLVRLGDTHAKLLVVDQRFAVVTSFNWLSFRGDPNRPFRDERGTLITVASEVERLFDEYSSRFDARAD